MKKYSLELKLIAVLLVVLYILPISIYWMNNFNNINTSNLLFILYPITFFICSTFEARYSGNFYLFPIGSSILFIPLAFTIYDTSYLPCFFLYLIVSLIGGLFGYWCNEKEDVRKSFKQAIGIISILAAIFTLIATILYYVLYKCAYDVCTLNDIINMGNIPILIFVIFMFLLGRYCLKKKKG